MLHSHVPRRLLAPLNSHASLFLNDVGVPTVLADGRNWPTLVPDECGDEVTCRRAVEIQGIASTRLVLNVLSYSECEEAIRSINAFGMNKFAVGKNNHGALQVFSTEAWALELERRLAPFLPSRFEINRRLRIYAYEANGKETFSRHVDAAFEKSVLGTDGKLSADASMRSRLSVLIYLNADFEGGETAFYAPLAEASATRVAVVQPVGGAVLLFPQASSDVMQKARWFWPTHEGAPVRSGRRPKYVVRTDVLFDAVVPNHLELASAVLDWPHQLYSTYMGVEHVAPLLYSLVRFLKPVTIAEIGSGYTTLFLLRALRDNERELARLKGLGPDKRRLLDWPWIADRYIDNYEKPSLHCVDDCKHGAQSASRTQDVAAREGLERYLNFEQGDAFDAKFSDNSIDFFWCDFGAGENLPFFLTTIVLPAVKNGGFVAIHSSVTNQVSRTWLEALRDGSWPPASSLHHISFLEPHKNFQNSITLLQKRRQPPPDSFVYAEPIYSIRP